MIVQVRTATTGLLRARQSVFLAGHRAWRKFSEWNEDSDGIHERAGRAVAAGFKPNSIAGNFQIRVTASHQGMTGSASISQSNTGAAAGVASGKLIAILAAVGGAVIGGVIIAKGGDDADVVQPQTIVISSGAPNVGPPK